MSEGIGTTTITQVGLIVRDIEKSIDAYMEIFGVEKRPDVRITGPVEQTNMKFRGAPSEARAKLAFFPMGQVTIELIEPVGGPSTWQEFLDTKGEGVHHIAFQVQGTPQVVNFLGSKGAQLEQQGDYTGGMYSYVDTAPKLGVILELLENFRK